MAIIPNLSFNKINSMCSPEQLAFFDMIAVACWNNKYLLNEYLDILYISGNISDSKNLMIYSKMKQAAFDCRNRYKNDHLAFLKQKES